MSDDRAPENGEQNGDFQRRAPADAEVSRERSEEQSGVDDEVSFDIPRD